MTYAAQRSIMDYTKICEACGDIFAKPSNQPWGRWRKRRFCCRECWWMTRPNWNRYAKDDGHSQSR